MASRRVLAIYYSLTGQTRAVVERIARALEEGGHQVELAEVRPAGSAYALPYPKGRFFWEWLKAWLGVKMRVPVEPLSLAHPPSSYDLILLGHQPWYLDTAIPMASWLESDEAALLAGHRVISVITARTLWERAFARAARRVEGLGGRIVDSFVVRNLVPMPQNMALTLHHLFEGGASPPRPLAPLGRFGVGEAGLAAAEVYGRILSLRLSHDLLDDTLTHTEANRQGLLRGAARSELDGWRGSATRPTDS